MPIRQASRRHHASADLFEAPAAPTPAGFRYAPDLFSPEVEKAFVAQFETLPFKPFEFHGYLGNRRVVSFGYRYDYAGRALRSAEEMPAFLAPLRRIASEFAGIPESDLAQALVTEYAPGAGIGWHRDKPMFQDVVALSFLAPCVLRLRRADGCGLGARGGGNRATLGLSASWPGAHRLGAQHRADGRVTLFRDVPILPA